MDLPSSRSALRVCAVATLLLAPARASAESAADQAKAEALFGEGRRLLAASRFAEACPKFVESQRLDPAIGTQLNLGDCYEKTGRTASAWAVFRDAAAEAQKGGATRGARPWPQAGDGAGATPREADDPRADRQPGAGPPGEARRRRGRWRGVERGGADRSRVARRRSERPGQAALDAPGGHRRGAPDDDDHRPAARRSRGASGDRRQGGRAIRSGSRAASSRARARRRSARARSSRRWRSPATATRRRTAAATSATRRASRCARTRSATRAPRRSWW